MHIVELIILSHGGLRSSYELLTISNTERSGQHQNKDSTLDSPHAWQEKKNQEL